VTDNGVLISIQNVSKRYQGAGFRAPWRRKLDGQEFWALRNIDIDVERGECFGILGPNGSGKSTLLEIVSGILEPTEGRVLLGGRVSALLELGAGFNPEFTGIENVRLNAELLGMSRESIEARMPEIEAFAEIGEFFRRPVREYSSGMYVRLAFAAAIHQEPEILIVDEALAVGDVRFANKCIRRLEEMRGGGTTILFVSHDLGLVKKLCERAALLWEGKLALLGSAKDVCDLYVRRAQAEVSESGALVEGPATLVSFAMDSARYEIGQRVHLEARVQLRQGVSELQFGVLIRNRQGVEVAGTNNTIEQVRIGPIEEASEITVRVSFPCVLTRGDYSVTLAVQSPKGEPYDWRDDCLSFQVLDTRDYAGSVRLDVTFGWSSDLKRDE
jgi:ABC-type polysaccharide/polyol phosphate transport system ATPase subunit